MEFAKIGTEQMILLVLETVLMILLPLVAAIVWTIRKKEKFSTVIIGAATFLLFVLVLEKNIAKKVVKTGQYRGVGVGNRSARELVSVNF